MCLFHSTAHSIFVMNIRKTTSTNINTRSQRITGHIFLDKEAICEIDHLQQCLPVKTTWWSFNNIQEACAVTQKSRRQYHHSNRWSSLLLLEASFTWQLQQVTSLVSVSCLYIKKQNQTDTFTLSHNALDVAKVHFPCRRKLLLSYWLTWPELGLTWCCTGTQLAMPSEAKGRLQERRVVSCTWKDANLPCSGTTISLILLATSNRSEFTATTNGVLLPIAELCSQCSSIGNQWQKINTETIEEESNNLNKMSTDVEILLHPILLLHHKRRTSV